ncbi:MAG: hypothetical protein R3263_01900 [Myxococcota bacterium]|nr:hypothetical protein [Myxococcota bacterium]
MSPVSDSKGAKPGPDRPKDAGEASRRGGPRAPAGRRGRVAAEDPEESEVPEPWEEEPPPVRPESAGFFPDLLRRGLTLGFTGVFMTEEAVRRALGDSVPRDLIDYFVAQSDRTRAELLDRLSREFGRVLSSLDPAEVARRLLEGRTVEVKASFRLVPDPRATATGGGTGRDGDDAEDESEDTGGSVSRSTRERR